MGGRTSGRRSGEPTQRARRMGEVVRHALATILARGDLRDPDLANAAITVTEVRPSPDLKSATVFVTRLGGGEAASLVKALKRARGYLRMALGREIDAKFTPELRFVEDTAFDTSQRIATALKEVGAGQGDGGADGGGDDGP